MEKRRSKRFPRRVTVRFGEQELERSGITYDISSTGAFIVSSFLPPIDSRVHLQVAVGVSRALFLEGIVRRHRIVPPSLRQIERGGFGVRFLTPAELISEVVPQLGGGNRFEVVFPDRERFSQAWEQQLRHGGLFLVTDKKMARESAVSIELRLPFLGKSWVFPGHVVQQMESATPGLAIAFDDRREVEKALRPCLA
jgi:hypothetical protein